MGRLRLQYIAEVEYEDTRGLTVCIQYLCKFVLLTITSLAAAIEIRSVLTRSNWRTEL